MTGGGNYREPVKVVIINTQYIETDPVSFKSVVQRLTGKDATAETIKRLPPAPPILAAASERQQTGTGKVASGNSFKDLDMLLLMELPSLDELYQLYNMD